MVSLYIAHVSITFELNTQIKWYWVRSCFLILFLYIGLFLGSITFHILSHILSSWFSQVFYRFFWGLGCISIVKTTVVQHCHNFPPKSISKASMDAIASWIFSPTIQLLKHSCLYEIEPRYACCPCVSINSDRLYPQKYLSLDNIH